MAARTIITGCGEKLSSRITCCVADAVVAQKVFRSPSWQRLAGWLVDALVITAEVMVMGVMSGLT